MPYHVGEQDDVESVSKRMEELRISPYKKLVT